MTKRIQKLVMTVAALAAMALGGAVFANAQTTTPAATQQTAAPDRDNVQSGDQSTPDTGAASEAPGAESPETGAGSESGTANDGPGGHADPPGTANADHQFQGNE
jgi:hypothetical protein